MTYMSIKDESDDADPAGYVSVYGLLARLKNKPAVRALLKPVPDAHLLQLKPKQIGTWHCWDAKDEVDYWVFADGRTAFRLTIVGLNFTEAVHSRRVFRDRCSRAPGGKGRIEWVEGILRDVIDSRMTRH